MTSVEDIREAILALTSQDKARLMVKLGPDLCRAVMQNPESMKQMFPRCEEMMSNPDVQKVMRPMMEQMFRNVMGSNR